MSDETDTQAIARIEGSLIEMTTVALEAQQKASTTAAILFYGISIFDALTAAGYLVVGSYGWGLLFAAFSLWLWFAGAEHWKKKKAAVEALAGIERMKRGEWPLEEDEEK